MLPVTARGEDVAEVVRYQLTRRSMLGGGAAAAMTASGLGFDLARAQTVKRSLKIAGAKVVCSTAPEIGITSTATPWLANRDSTPWEWAARTSLCRKC